ncbi:MAG: hypothetical protein KTR26_17945 [Flammeovirgaceae bacterium]|nr:hypothetical protein [Flammeovirgaceae bacterium]
MSITQIRKELKDYIAHGADKKFLIMVYAMMKAYGYEKELENLPEEFLSFSKEELIARANLSDKAIEEGNVKSLEELRKKMKNW